MKKPFILSLSLLALAACDTTPKLDDGQYWQRRDTSSALHLRGPKAQQTLHRDIASCVAQVNELERLGTLKKAVPAPIEEPDADDIASRELGTFDTPERDGFLGTEDFEFTDFETCMRVSGWERVETLPYDVSQTARRNYIDTIIGDSEPETTDNVSVRSDNDRDPFDDLNE